MASPSSAKLLLASNLLFCLLNILWGLSLFRTRPSGSDDAALNFDGSAPGGAGVDAAGGRREAATAARRRAPRLARDDFDPPPAEECTAEQRDNITYSLGLRRGGRHISHFTACPEASWIDGPELFEGDARPFVGISVGCNKGHDALRTARRLSNDPAYDGEAWRDAVDGRGAKGGVCRQQESRQPEIAGGPRREGEVHCIEPLPGTFALLKEARRALNLSSESFVLSHAAISSRDGVARFPNGYAGVEDFGIFSCNDAATNGTVDGTVNGTVDDRILDCVDVPMYSLDSYVDRFVRSPGPVSVLQIDAEGHDFDVLFGASSVLDRTRYVEFEYHWVGRWGTLHLQDAVRLLDGKGFTCYWAGRGRLWRITGCYVDDVYDRWRGWSNVACARRDRAGGGIAARMEDLFRATIARAGPPPMDLERWCGTCAGGFCDQRASFLVHNEGYELDDARIRIMGNGHCIEKEEDVEPKEGGWS